MSETGIKDHIWQIGSCKFKFDIITSSRIFQHHMQQMENRFLNICDDALSNLTAEEIQQLDRNQYQNIVQKSSTWLTLRSEADGTASSVGKYIKGPPTYPSFEDIRTSWEEKKLPFRKTHPMIGHMRWGVGYEDPALVHFALYNNVNVTQIGTIRVDLEDILTIGNELFPEWKIHEKWRNEGLTVEGKHLLISPDGLVSHDTSEKYSGMVEIKCISPFHHIETDVFLEWAMDMEARQWQHASDIPFVYIVQLGLQAISGKLFYNMTDNACMWFVRWSPHGFAQFTISFGHLFKLGVISGLLYLSQTQKNGSPEAIKHIFPYKGLDRELYLALRKAYNEVIDHMEREYIPIDDYPEFDIYHECTEHFRFKVEEDQLPKSSSYQGVLPPTLTNIALSSVNTIPDTCII